MASNSKHDPHHVTPFSTYIEVAVALFALTFLTVIAYQFRHTFGPLAAPIAFLIAGVKASLVMMYFMHLKYDSWENRVIFATGFIFLAIMFSFSAADIWTRVFETSTL